MIIRKMILLIFKSLIKFLMFVYYFVSYKTIIFPENVFILFQQSFSRTSKLFFILVNYLSTFFIDDFNE
jgi:hypothetical protein